MGQCMGRKPSFSQHQPNSQKYLAQVYRQQYKSKNKSEVLISRIEKEGEERHAKDEKTTLYDNFIPITNASVVSGNESMVLNKQEGGNSVMKGRGMKKIKQQESIDVRIEKLLRKNRRIRQVYRKVSLKFSQ